mmetsp:Transcript_92740/g.198806  ORF Transcript_92740/g.198806 Transcript_92740/m.198806 type:complete len:430 (-) Transcript_92740:122-1411(-)
MDTTGVQVETDPESAQKGAPESKCKCCQKCCPTTKKGRLICCGAVCSCLAIFLLVIIIAVGAFAGPQISTLPNDTRADCTNSSNPGNTMRTTWLPGCSEGPKTDAQLDACGGSCFNSAFVSQIESFHTQIGWTLVSFPSRQGSEGQETVTIKAWYLPPAPGFSELGSPAPRVVVQHGTNQNQNKFESQVASFLLSSAGFGVLLLSLRDHDYSGDTEDQAFSWGWAYPYDLLAAWDYAKADPDGLLGGALPSDKVGVMGFSMGGFVAVTSFGVEHQVPGVWADAAVFSVKDILHHELSKILGFLSFLFIDMAWAFANHAAELHFMWPGKSLAGGPNTKRKLYVVQNTADTTVPESQAEALIDLIAEYPEQYTLVGTWFTSATCNGDTHRILHLQFPTEYRKRLCLFWSDVFKVSQVHCEDGSMEAIAGGG